MLLSTYHETMGENEIVSISTAQHKKRSTVAVGQKLPGSRFTAGEFINAIVGSAGVVAVIAKRVGCSRNTAWNWIREHPTVLAAYEDERATVLDLSESVIYGNIQAAAALQEISGYRVVVDSSDAKWLLNSLGVDRGYGAKAMITGADGGDIEIVVRYDSSPGGSAAVKKSKDVDSLIAQNGNA